MPTESFPRFTRHNSTLFGPCNKCPAAPKTQFSTLERAAAAHGAAAVVARHVDPLPAPITMPVHQTEVPLTAAGRTATFTLVEFPEDRHFIDIAMKKGK